MTQYLIDLTTLESICPLSRYLLGAYVEAAQVMLSDFHAVPPPPTPVRWYDESEEAQAALQWSEPDNAARRSHANTKDATEHGAYAVAIAAAHLLGFMVKHRALNESGCDFMMFRRGGNQEEHFMLEVSGIRRGGNVQARLREKVTQGSGGKTARPGMAVVVQFEQPAVALKRWQ